MAADIPVTGAVGGGPPTEDLRGGAAEVRNSRRGVGGAAPDVAALRGGAAEVRNSRRGLGGAAPDVGARRIIPLVAITLFAVALLACNGGPHDATEHTTDVRVDGGDDTYAYVAKRNRVAVGLAEVRGASASEAKDLVDRLAGSASGCFEGLAREGKLVDGAMRLVLAFDAGGVGGAPEVVLAPGPGVAANGLLCVVAPARMIALAPNDGGARAIALEIAWGASITGAGGSP